MIEQSQENQAKIHSFLISASEKQTQSQQFELYQHITSYLNADSNRQEWQMIVHQLLRNTKGKLFKALFCYFTNKITGRRGQELENSIVSFIKECLDARLEEDIEGFEKKKNITEVLLENKGYLMEITIELCRESQLRSKNLLISINEILIKKIKDNSTVGLYLTHTSLLALKVVQYWQNSSSILLEESFRHLLIVDHIQKGEILKIINQSTSILDSLIGIDSKDERVNGYWFYLIAKLSETNITSISQNSLKILHLQEKAMERIFKTVQKETDLSQQIFNILHSELSAQQKQRQVQLIRSYCMFTSEYAKKQISQGNLEVKVIKLIEQLMGIKDFISFQSLVVQYADICRLHQFLIEKLSSQVIKRIQRNCLPQFRSYSRQCEERCNQEIMFLTGKIESFDTYEPSNKSSESMQFLLDKILEERGCKLKPRVCPCFDSYIHSTIEDQYDQAFNQHDFTSSVNLICREISRVLALNPSVSELQDLKSYLFSNLKWLLNLNQSCLPQFRRCIIFKIFDIIISFPYILHNNDFLQIVIQDLLVNRIPDTLYFLTKLFEFFKKDKQQGNEIKLQRMAQKLLEKACLEILSLSDKINIWNFVFGVIESNQTKLKEALSLYSFHEDHWIAKNCAATHRKIKVFFDNNQKISEILEKWQSNPQFFSSELSTIRTSSDSK